MSLRKKSSPKITKAMTAGFRSDYARQAKKICELGGTLDDLADAFGVKLAHNFVLADPPHGIC